MLPKGLACASPCPKPRSSVCGFARDKRPVRPSPDRPTRAPTGRLNRPESLVGKRPYALERLIVGTGGRTQLDNVASASSPPEPASMEPPCDRTVSGGGSPEGARAGTCGCPASILTFEAAPTFPHGSVAIEPPRVTDTSGHLQRPTCAHSRIPMDLIWSGSVTSLFQASHMASMMAS